MKSFLWAAIGVLLGIVIGFSSCYAIIQQPTQSSNLLLQSEINSLRDQLQKTQTALNDTEATNANLQQENTNLQQESTLVQRANVDLQTMNTDLAENNTALTLENAQLESQIKQTKAAQLATRLGVRNCNWDYNDTRLYIAGEVWNVGTSTADNCSLHVMLYSGSVTELDTYLEIGSIPSGTYKDIAENIHYSGFALTDWTIIPECNA